MKKIISILFSILLVFAFSVPAYAADNTVHLEYEAEEGEEIILNQGFEVKVRVRYSSGLPEFPLTNGSGGGTLPDSTEISVTGAPSGATYLVVRQIAQTETEPYTWFKEVLGDKAMQAYEIYFRDDVGNRIAASGTTIKVETPDGMTDITVWSVDPDESNKQLAANISNGTAIFRTDGKRYYVLTGIKSEITPTPTPDPGDDPTPTPTPTPKPDDGKTPPKTGDESNTLLWLGLAVVAMIGMLICIICLKRKKRDTEKAE